MVTVVLSYLAFERRGATCTSWELMRSTSTMSSTHDAASCASDPVSRAEIRSISVSSIVPDPVPPITTTLPALGRTTPEESPPRQEKRFDPCAPSTARSHRSLAGEREAACGWEGATEGGSRNQKWSSMTFTHQVDKLTFECQFINFSHQSFSGKCVAGDRSQPAVSPRRRAAAP